MIKRERYLKQIRDFYDSDLVKVIVGIRRCGKSVILNQIQEEIEKISDNVISLNFEKVSDLMKVSTSFELMEYVSAHRKEGKCFVFLDEIQEVEDWQIAVKSLRLENTSIFITGSNSKLLSKEFLTLLSGRFVSFQIRPFVYKEIQEYAKENNRQYSYMNYLIWGGFPGRLASSTMESMKVYLNDLEATIVINDLIRRYHIKKVVPFKKLVSYILKSNARIYSARSIQSYLNSQTEKIALNTVLSYLEYLKEAYIIDELKQYSPKTKKELAYYGKIYDADVSFNSLSVFSNRYDLDHNLENIVYNELLYMGYDLKTYDNNGREIDFIANKDGKNFLVQVAYSVYDEKAYQREISAFKGADDMMARILITNDELDYSTSLVRHIRLKDFLLMEEL